MAQTPCLLYAAGNVCDYTPGSAVAAGKVVLLGTIPTIAPAAIAANEKGSLALSGVWRVPQKAEIQTAGNAVYWDASGDPYGGTAGSGAATGSASVYLMGVCLKTSAATDTYVIVHVQGCKRTATIGGAVTASDIEAEDSTLNVNGLDAAQGGLVAILGGTSSTAGNAGGATSLVGGVGGATGAGGSASVVGGVSGATSGTGGAAYLTGGAAGSAASNAIGGAAVVTGGIGKGNLAGGAATVTGGVAGATGIGGAVAITGGIGGATSGTGGAVAIAGGAGTNANANGGAVAIDGGAPNGSGTAGAITIGTNNAASITMGKMPRFPVAAKTATGSTQAHALASPTAILAEGINIVAGADDTTGVALPTAVAGEVVIVKSTVAGKNLQIWPNTDDAINAIAANGVYAVAADAGSLMLYAADATTWYTLPLVAS